MNTNRMNNRCMTPPGVPYQNRPIARPGNVVCHEVCDTVCSTPCPETVASGVVGGIIGAQVTSCDKEKELFGLPLAMAYVPWQEYANLYSVSQAVRKGTLFAELDLDFLGRRCN